MVPRNGCARLELYANLRVSTNAILPGICIGLLAAAKIPESVGIEAFSLHPVVISEWTVFSECSGIGIEPLRVFPFLLFFFIH